MNRRQSIELFEAEVRKDSELMGRLGDLHGRALACHCAGNQLCHADVLVRLFASVKAAAIAELSGAPPLQTRRP